MDGSNGGEEGEEEEGEVCSDMLCVCVCVCVFRVPSLSSPQAPQLVLLSTVFPHLHSALQGRKLDSLLLAHRVSPLQDAVT